VFAPPAPEPAAKPEPVAPTIVYQTPPPLEQINEPWANELREKVGCSEAIIHRFSKAGLTNEYAWRHASSRLLALVACDFSGQMLVNWQALYSKPDKPKHESTELLPQQPMQPQTLPQQQMQPQVPPQQQMQPQVSPPPHASQEYTYQPPLGNAIRQMKPVSVADHAILEETVDVNMDWQGESEDESSSFL
jgi:hypothetical protein